MANQFILSFGNSAMSFGGASAGWEAPYAPTLPYLVFRFKISDYNPRRLGPASSRWTRVSGSPSNDWYWECDYFYDTGTGSYAYGWPAAFSGTTSTPVGHLTAPCDIIGFGNLTASSRSLVSMDRMFTNCTGLRHVVTIQTPNTLENVGGTYSGCTKIIDGMLDQYTYWSTNNTNISNHSGTFTDAGSDTTTGLAELDQIPAGWGGNLVPASTLMTSACRRWKGSYDTWEIIGDTPTWTDVADGMYLFTEASVSAYAGVSMNRGRINKFKGLVTKASAALYFYPCFMQHNNNGILWAVTTSLPNDHLKANESNRDMPGTLDYSTYGPFKNEYGTYDSSEFVYFCFLVTNVPIADWTGLTDAYGVLYNSNFKADGGFRWYF